MTIFLKISSWIPVAAELALSPMADRGSDFAGYMPPPPDLDTAKFSPTTIA